ncbi:hypothetical protein K8R47_02485 [archaeon]|nr:hypothetical protein [archaeon]
MVHSKLGKICKEVKGFYDNWVSPLADHPIETVMLLGALAGPVKALEIKAEGSDDFRRYSLTGDLGRVIYDDNMGSDTDKLGLDLNLNHIVKPKNVDIGFFAYQKGRVDNEDLLDVGLWGKTSFGDSTSALFTSAFLDIETIIEQGNYPMNLALGGLYNSILSGQVAGIQQKEDIDFWSWGALHNDRFYVSYGEGADNKKTGLVGVFGLEDFGNLSYGSWNTATKKWSVTSKTGIDSVNQGFFSQGNADLGSSIFNMGMFFTPHFSHFTTKGQYTVKLHGEGDSENSEYEVVLGKRLPFVDLGLGANTTLTSNVSPVVEVNKSMDVYGTNVNFEGIYNSRNGDFDFYTTVSKGF